MYVCLFVYVYVCHDSSNHTHTHTHTSQSYTHTHSMSQQCFTAILLSHHARSNTTTHTDGVAQHSLDPPSERSVIQLIVPSRHPFIGTKGLVDFLKVLAQFVVFTLYLLAAMKVHIILPAIPCLILIRESCIKRSRL